MSPDRSGHWCDRDYCSKCHTDRIRELTARVGEAEEERDYYKQLIRELEKLHPLGSDIEGCCGGHKH